MNNSLLTFLNVTDITLAAINALMQAPYVRVLKSAECPSSNMTETSPANSNISG